MKDLFGNDVPSPDEVKTQRTAELAHNKLIMLHGKSEGNKCKSCIHFIRKEFAKTYFKCANFRTGASEGSDWRANWEACGLFQKEE